MAQQVVKYRGCLFVGRMDCRCLDRSDLLAARNDSLPARMDWLGHTRLHHSRRVAMKDHRSAPAGSKNVAARLPHQAQGTLSAERTVV